MLLRNSLAPFMSSGSSYVSLHRASVFASTSSSTSVLHYLRPYPALSSSQSSLQCHQVRFRGTLIPRRSKYRKAHKGRVPIRTGGSTAGTTLEHGDFGIRVNQAVRFSAKQLSSAQEALKRGIKQFKGAKVFLRVFPDIPVCVKVCLASVL